MFVRKLASFLACLLGIAISTASAQSEARIRTVVPSLEENENDLKALIELSPDASLRKQWKSLKEDILDAMTQGVDLSKPASVDIVFRKDELAYEFRIPIKNLDGNNGFLAALQGMGFKVKDINKGAYYSFAEKKAQSPYYLRYDKNYAWVSKSPMPDVPPAEATQDLQPSLKLQKDVVASLKNDAAGLAARRDNFKKLRQQFEALVKFRRNEDPNAFELRKLTMVQQLNEAERYLVEAEEFLATWNTETKSPATARGEISLTALPGTELLKSIQNLATKSSHFANVKLHAEPVAQGRVNFALDSLRAGQIKDFYKAVRPTLDGEIGKLPSLSDSQKAGMKQASTKFLDMLDAGLSLGVVDLFADGYAAQQGKNVFVCGILSADGTAADEIVKLLPQMDPEWKVKLAVSKHADVTIHEITVHKALLPAFQKLFASETVLYVGTSKNVVWGAAGLDATKALEAAIDQTAGPVPDKVDPVVVSYKFQLDQVVNLLDLVQKAAPKKTAPAAATKDAKADKDQKQREKNAEKYRKLAQDAMSGCKALIQGELKKSGDKVEGYVELSDCVLKYVGSLIASGVKDLN